MMITYRTVMAIHMPGDAVKRRQPSRHQAVPLPEATAPARGGGPEDAWASKPVALSETGRGGVGLSMGARRGGEEVEDPPKVARRGRRNPGT